MEWGTLAIALTALALSLWLAAWQYWRSRLKPRLYLLAVERKDHAVVEFQSEKLDLYLLYLMGSIYNPSSAPLVAASLTMKLGTLAFQEHPGVLDPATGIRRYTIPTGMAAAVLASDEIVFPLNVEPGTVERGWWLVDMKVLEPRPSHEILLRIVDFDGAVIAETRGEITLESENFMPG